jgi:hypothetical protein
MQLRPLERAAFFAQYREKKLRNVIQSGTAAFGNAATRIEAFVAAGGVYAYGSYGDIDGLFREQAAEMDRKKREAILVKIQQLIHDKGHVCADLGARVAERRRAARGRVGPGPDPDARVLRALRGPQAQG